MNEALSTQGNDDNELSPLKRTGTSEDGEWAIFTHEITGNVTYIPTRTMFDFIDNPPEDSSL